MKKRELFKEFWVVLILTYIIKYNVVAENEPKCNCKEKDHFYDGNIPSCTECVPKCRDVSSLYLNNCLTCCPNNGLTTTPALPVTPTKRLSSSSNNTDDRLWIVVAVIVTLVLLGLGFCAGWHYWKRDPTDNRPRADRYDVEMPEYPELTVELPAEPSRDPTDNRPRADRYDVEMPDYPETVELPAEPSRNVPPQLHRTEYPPFENNNNDDQEIERADTGESSCSSVRNRPKSLAIPLSTLRDFTLDSFTRQIQSPTDSALSQTTSQDTLSSNNSPPLSPHEHDPLCIWKPEGGHSGKPIGDTDDGLATTSDADQREEGQDRRLETDQVDKSMRPTEEASSDQRVEGPRRKLDTDDGLATTSDADQREEGLDRRFDTNPEDNSLGTTEEARSDENTLTRNATNSFSQDILNQFELSSSTT